MSLILNQGALNALIGEQGLAIRHYGVVLLDIMASVGEDLTTYYHQAAASRRLGMSKGYMNKAVHALVSAGFIEILESDTKALKVRLCGAILVNGNTVSQPEAIAV